MGINLRARGYDTVEEKGNFERLPAGGYVCRIVDAQITRSKKNNETLKILVDISEGKHAGTFKKLFDGLKKKKPDAKWSRWGTMYQNLFDSDGNVNGGLKSLFKAIEGSNYGLTINVDDFDERQLKGNLVGMIFGDEEYEKQDGTIGIAAQARFPRSADKIREGDFKIPELKKLDKPATEQIEPPSAQTNNDAFALDDPPF